MNSLKSRMPEPTMRLHPRHPTLNRRLPRAGSPCILLVLSVCHCNSTSCFHGVCKVNRNLVTSMLYGGDTGLHASVYGVLKVCAHRTS